MYARCVQVPLEVGSGLRTLGAEITGWCEVGAGRRPHDFGNSSKSSEMLSFISASIIVFKREALKLLENTVFLWFCSVLPCEILFFNTIISIENKKQWEKERKCIYG